jgi:eukaryotic-like serine/threonine-protein kinase
MKSRLRLILVGLFFALIFVFVGLDDYHIVVGSFSSGDPGWVLNSGNQIQINRQSNASPDGLRDGDQLISLNGTEYKNYYTYDRFFSHSSPGVPYTVLIKREGQTLEFTLKTAPWSLFFRGISTTISIVKLAFLFVGLVIFLLKPDDKRAVLLGLLLAMFCGTSISGSLETAYLPAWLIVILASSVAASGLFGVIFLHFFLVFPDESPLLRRFPRLEYHIYWFFLLTVYPGRVITAFRWAAFGEGLFEPKHLPLWFTRIGFIAWAIYLVGGLLSLIINYRYANQLSRRKLRVVVAGMLVGFLPLLTSIIIVDFFLHPSDPAGSYTSPLFLVTAYISIFALILIPISFAYAILRHQVIPVSLIIRRSLQYLFAKNALRGLIALPILGIVLSVLANPHRTLDEMVLRSSFYFYVLLTAAIAFGLVLRRKLTDWIDRKFFREAYNQEKILRELIDEVKSADSIPDVSKLVSQKVSTALHPERLYLFYREHKTRDFSLGYSSEAPQHELKIPEEFQLLHYMELQGGTQDFPFPQKNNLPQSEKDWLAKLHTQLIVPMTRTDGKLAGLFLLGPKKSEIPYTATDRQLLETLADQIALVYENVRLKERVDHDRKIRHEVLARIEDRQINLLKECPRCGACFNSEAQVCSKDSTELNLSLPVERTIEQRYRLDQLLGKGGMGAVYEAVDLRLNRPVAVKILSGSMFGNSEALRRFEREAQISARLNHPNVVAIHDYGLLTTEGAYLVMELAPGQTLRSTIKRRGRISSEVAAEWFDQICEAIKAAHQIGITHRDLKPENIMIFEKETGPALVQVLDFGLAKVRQPNISDPLSPTALSTTPGTLMGTFGYMSPEQIMGEEVDERTDIFSIGVVLVEALTGERPFKGSTHHDLLTNILQGSFHLGGESPEVKNLDNVLQQCLAKDRALRFSTIVEMQTKLIGALRRAGLLIYPAESFPDAQTLTLDRLTKAKS